MTIDDLYECPTCFHVSRWTDGLEVRLGDDRDEFWCQVCGEESPLEACRRIDEEMHP